MFIQDLAFQLDLHLVTVGMEFVFRAPIPPHQKMPGHEVPFHRQRVSVHDQSLVLSSKPHPGDNSLLIGQNNLDDLVRVTVDHLVSLCSPVNGIPMRDEAGRLDLFQHLPGDLIASGVVPAAGELRCNTAHLAADEPQPAAMEAAAQV